MSLKMQQTTGTGGSGSGRRIGPASKTNRAQGANDVIDVDLLDDKPLSQIVNQQKSINQSNEKSDVKKSLIPISTNEKNNQVSLTTTSSPASPPNEIKNGKETKPSSAAATMDSKNCNKNTEKNGHNNDQSKISTSLPQPSTKESKSTNGHKNEEIINKKSNQQSNNGNEEQKDSKIKEDKILKDSKTKEDKLVKDSKIKEDKLKQAANNDTISDSEKPGPKFKKLADKEKKKTNEEIGNTNIDSVQQSTPLKRSSQRTAAAAAQANASLSSLANEKELKGFNEVGDEEMESLLLQIDTSDVVEKPTKSLLTPTKVTTSTSIKEKRNDQDMKKNDQEMKKIDIATPPSVSKKSPIKPPTIPFSQPPITSTPDSNKQQHSYLPRPSSASVRSISGRRSLRPLNKEYSFHNTTNYRDSYRKLQTEFDCTGNTSLNVTVGSEIAQPDITSTSFSFFGRGKKRERISPSTQSNVQKSPEHCQLINDGDNNELDTSLTKRARLDFSGFFGIVASPVTMLRARLSRAKIQNTPKYNDDIEEGVENFSGIIGEKNENDIIVDKKDDNCEDEDVEIEEISMKDDDDNDDDENAKINMKNIKDISDATVASEDNELIVTEHENRRSRCLLM